MNAPRDVAFEQLEPTRRENGQDPGAHAALLQLGTRLGQAGYRFITPTPATHERVNRREGNQWAQELAGVFGWSRRFLPSAIAPDIFELMQKADVLEPLAGGALRSRVRASSLGEQLFFHSAYPTTDAASVFFGPDTYRFAQAIDRWFEAAPRAVNRAIDICCGAGPGAITIAQHCPYAEVFATDINHQALALANVNVALAGTLNVKPRFSNLLKDVEGEFDLIVANPPYLVDPAGRAYRHGGGRFGDGLSLDILASSLERLSPGGTLLLYTASAIVNGEDLFFQAAGEMMEPAKVSWKYREMDPDVFGEELETEAYSEADRIAAVVLEVTKAA